MKNLYDSYSWYKANKKISSLLQPSAEQSLWLHGSMGQALFDVVYGGALFNSHKKSIAYIRGRSNFMDPVLPLFYKQSYNVQSAWEDQIESVEEWVKTLKVDTLFVVIFADHAITGESYDRTQEFIEILNQKRIYAIVVHHHQLYRGESEPYTVRISPFNQEQAVSRLGARFKAPAIVSPLLRWPEGAEEKAIDFFEPLKKYDETVIKKYKDDLPKTFSLFSADDNNQLLTIISAKVGADSVISSLKNEKIAHALFTTQTCSSEVRSNYMQWWRKCPNPEQLRGLLVIPYSLCGEENFRTLLSQVVEKILQEQGWKTSP